MKILLISNSKMISYIHDCDNKLQKQLEINSMTLLILYIMTLNSDVITIHGCKTHIFTQGNILFNNQNRYQIFKN